MSYLQACKYKLCFQMTHKFLNLPLSFTHTRATYILRHYTSQPASVGYGRMYTLHPPPKTLEGSTTTEKWLTCHHRCACASINKSDISRNRKSEGGREPRTPAPTSTTNHAYQKKEHVCTHAQWGDEPSGCSGSPLKYMHIYDTSRVHTITRVTVVTTSANSQPCFKMTTENSHINYHSTDCTKARNAPLQTRDSNPFYSKNWLHGVRGQ